jgi:hypothetical protein
LNSWNPKKMIHDFTRVQGSIVKNSQMDKNDID